VWLAVQTFQREEVSKNGRATALDSGRKKSIRDHSGGGFQGLDLTIAMREVRRGIRGGLLEVLAV